MKIVNGERSQVECVCGKKSRWENGGNVIFFSGI